MISKIIDLTKNKTIRNGSLFSLFSFLNSGISFLLIVILAKFIDPEGYGKINLFNTAVMLFGYFIALNSSGIITVNYFRKREGLNRTINSVLILSLISFVGLGLFCVLFSSIIEEYLGFSLKFQLLSLLICFFNIYSTITLNLWRVEEKVLSYGVYSVLKTISFVIITLLLVIVFKKDWLGQVYGNFLSALAFFVISLLVLIRRKYLTVCVPSRVDIVESIKYGIPLIPHSISFWLRNGLDRLLINNAWGTSIVGLFSFSSNFAFIIQIVGEAFNATNSVYIYKNLANRNAETKAILRKQTLLMISLYAIVTLFVILCVSILLPYLFPKYSGCVHLLPIQCITAFFSCVYLQFVNYIFYYKKTKILMYITSTSSVIHMILSFYLTRYSIYYTLYIGLFSQVLITIGVFLYSRKVYKII